MSYSHVMNLISYWMKAQFNLEPNFRDNQMYQEILLTSKPIFQDKKSAQNQKVFIVADQITLVLQDRTASNIIETIDWQKQRQESLMWDQNLHWKEMISLSEIQQLKAESRILSQLLNQRKKIPNAVWCEQLIFSPTNLIYFSFLNLLSL